jgi:hypothetical protein
MPSGNGQGPRAVYPVFLDGPLAGVEMAVPYGARRFIAERPEQASAQVSARAAVALPPLVYTIDKVGLFGRFVLIAHVSQKPPLTLLWDVLASDRAKKAAL